MATIRDVARESSVSIATVSRVFNNSPLVSDGTRRRVMVAAERLGYWPNGIARSLITSRTHAIGVLLPDLHGEFFSEVIHGIDVAARGAGLHLLVSRASSTHSELESALRSMRGRVDALVIMAPDPEASASLRQFAGHVPTVLLHSGAVRPEWDVLNIANRDGARDLVRHLVAVGHRRIATITGPAGNLDACQRLAGYHAALEEAGLAPSHEVPGDFTEPSGYAAGRALLERSPRPTAVFVGNDHMAIGVMGALHDAGVRVPSDLAVAGFDDIPMARYLTPPLTTVHVDLNRMGQRAVQMLLEQKRSDDRPLPRQEVLPVTLVVRGSCGADAADGAGVPAWNRDRADGATRG